MRFQLVLQFEAAQNAHGYDKLVQFEETLIAAVGQTALVDGHDAGSGEMNIFILTDDTRYPQARPADQCRKTAKRGDEGCLSVG